MSVESRNSIQSRIIWRGKSNLSDLDDFLAPIFCLESLKNTQKMKPTSKADGSTNPGPRCNTQLSKLISNYIRQFSTRIVKLSHTLIYRSYSAHFVFFSFLSSPQTIAIAISHSRNENHRFNFAGSS